MINKKEEKKQQAILTVAHHDHEKGLNLYAFYKLHDQGLSQDLVQDVFMKTWAYLLKSKAEKLIS